MFLKKNFFLLQDLNTRLKQLINTEEVMLFMKGTPAEPRCGMEMVFNTHASNYWGHIVLGLSICQLVCLSV